jgi:hypothetical protein
METRSEEVPESLAIALPCPVEKQGDSMESQENTEGKEQKTASQEYYECSVGYEGLVLYLRNKEKEQAEHHQNKSRWYHDIGGWMRRLWWSVTGGLRRFATVIIMFATLVNVGVAYY